MKLQRTVAALTAAMLLLCGCQKADPAEAPAESREPSAETQALTEPVKSGALTNIASAETLWQADEPSGFTDISTTGGRIRASLWTMTNQVRILSMQPDGSDLQTSVLTPPAAHDGFYYAGSVPVFGEETVWSIAQLDYHSGMEPPPDYNTDPEAYENYDWDTYNADVQNEFYLCENAMDGTLLRYAPVTGLEEYREDFTVYQMLWHPENGLLMLTGTGFILQIAEDGSLRELCEIPQRLDAVSSQGLVTGGDGTLYLWQTGTQPGDPLYLNELYPVDLAAGTVGEAIYSAESVSKYFLSGGGEYAAFLPGQNGLTGIRPDGTLETVIDYSASDLPLMYCCAMEDGSFAAYSPYDEKPALYRLTRKYESEIGDPVTLRIAIVGAGDTAQFRAFNRSHDFRVELVDYWDEEAFRDAEDSEKVTRQMYDKLKLDIISDNAPDLVILDDPELIRQLGVRGAFLDLNTFLDTDPGFNRDTLLPNILTAMQAENGAVYALPGSFAIDTMAVKTRLCDKENWTMDDLMDLYADAGEDQLKWHSQEEILGMLLYGTDFVDEQAGTCRFDSPEFIRMLEFCGRYPSEVAEPPKDYESQDAMDKFNKWHLDNYMRYKHDEDYLLSLALLPNEGGMASSWSYARYGDLGEDMTLVGYPSADGKGGLVEAMGMLSITSACKHQEEAWEFLRFYLSAAGTKEGAFMAQGGFSLLNETFEQQLDDCMYIMFDGRSDAEYYEDDGSKIYPMTQEERDTVEAYIRSCDKLRSISEQVTAIVYEEAQMYFAGDRSAEETAAMIQKRASILVSEQS